MPNETIRAIDPADLIDQLYTRIAQQNQRILRQQEQIITIHRLASTALVANVPEWDRATLRNIQRCARATS